MWDDERLIDIHRAASQALAFAEDRSVRDLSDEPLVLSAVLYQLTVLGEAVKRLSAAFRAGHAEIEWKKIAGARDRIVHDYNRIAVEVVHEILSRELPELIRFVEPLLPPKPTD